MDGFFGQAGLAGHLEQIFGTDIRNANVLEAYRQANRGAEFQHFFNFFGGGVFQHQLRKRLEDRKIRLELTDEARKFIADAGYDPVYGARPLKRYVQQAVETPLAKELVGGKIRDGQCVPVDAADGKLTFKAE